MNFTISFVDIGVLLIMSLILVGSAPLNEEFVKSNGDFAMSFYDHLSKEENVQEKSFVVSPYSIQTCGGLLFAGSSGRTAKQMYTGFNLVSMNTTTVGSSFKQSLDQYVDSPFMKILNKIYLMKDNAIEPAYQQVATKYFHSAVDVIDFGKNIEASKSINDWVSANTNNKINDLLSSDAVGYDTKMLLLNVIHFKGEWKYKFNVSDTKPAHFWKTPEQSVHVDMMSVTERFKFANYAELSALAVDIPFKGSDLSLFVIKPNARTKSIHDLEKRMKTTNLSALFNKVEDMKFMVTIPKFRIETEVDLKKVLSNVIFFSYN